MRANVAWGRAGEANYTYVHYVAGLAPGVHTLQFTLAGQPDPVEDASFAVR